MSRSVSHIVNAAASGIATRSYHANWSDVNPFIPQAKTRDEIKRDTFAFLDEQRLSRKRIARAVNNGARILPALA